MSANERNLQAKYKLGSHHLAAVMTGAMLFAAHVTASWADVTVYEKAPTAEELQQKLLGAGASGKKKVKTRAIVFGDDAPAEAAPAAASPAAPAQTASTPAPKPAAVTMQVSEDAIAFPIQFKVSSSQILPESAPFLQSIADLMRKDTSVRLLVEGHTDITGSYQSNVTLSRERARAVKNYLVNRFGIDAARLHPEGKGPTDLLPDLDPADPKHRRVQFRVIS